MRAKKRKTSSETNGSTSMASTAATTDAMALLPVRADDEEFTLETREVSPAHFLTKIERFSMLSKHGISQLESMEFEAGDYKWKVIIYPDGDESGKKVDHISVHLSMVGSLGITSLPASWEVYAIFNFFLYNHISHNYFCFRGKTQRFHAINSECGISKLMSKKRFREAANGILLNDECVFGAEVFVIKKQRVIENVCVLPLTDPYKREWEIPNFSKLGKVWRSEEFSSGGYKWKLVIHPNGIPKVEGRYLSIFVQCVDSKSFGAHKKVRATYLFIFINRLKNKKNYSKEVSHWFSCSKPDWGYQEFMGVGDVGDPSKGFVVQDTLQLEIQLSVQVSQEPLKLE